MKFFKTLFFNIFCILFVAIQAIGQSADSTQTEPAEIVIPTVDSALVKAQLASIQNTIPLNYNKYVHGFIDFFTYRKPSFTKSMLERKDYFFPIFEKYLSEYDIPDEIKYLSMIESALNPKAISYAGAVGLWQFMPVTGKVDFGLRIDKYVDERHHVVRSTVAACKYMRQLYRIFGDWELVLAAYNTGPGNVRRAIRKAGGGGFWKIYPYLHPQTRSYVPQYVAMVYMMHFAADYNIFPENHESIPASSPVLVSNYLNLKTLASLSNMPFELLQKVNPHILKGELPENTKDFLLSIPEDHYAFFDNNKQMILDSASKKLDTSKKPKNVDLIAQESSNTEELELDSPEQLEKIIKKRPKLKYHTVRRGENLTTIAKKYRVSKYDLKAWNGMKKSNTVRYGQKLKIYNEITEVAYKKKNAKKEVNVVEDDKEDEEIVKQEIAETAKIKTKKEKNSTPKIIENKVVEVSESSNITSLKPSTHKVKKGETLFKIANKYGVTMGDLREWNKIGSKGNVNVGQNLKIYGKPTESEEFVKVEKPIKTKTTTTKEIVVERNPKYHKVNRGDTIWSIAQKYDGLTVEKLRKLNGIKNDNIKQGQKLRLS